MDITDVRVKLIMDSSDRLKAVCTVTFDQSFVVRDVKVVEGTNGLFVAMPSRKLTANCPKCRSKNHVRARHCNECGSKLSSQEHLAVDQEGRSKLHRDIAHPITADFRAIMQEKVIEAFREECDGLEEERPDEVNKNVEANADDESCEPESSNKESDEYSAMIADLKGPKGSDDDRGNRSGGRPSGGRSSGGRQSSGRSSGGRSSSGSSSGGREGNGRESSGRESGGRDKVAGGRDKDAGGRGRGQRGDG